jgi:DNA-binding NarL/FixJ family response regulator/AraC-like DNA-binding protein
MYRALIVEDEPLMRQYLLDRLHDIHPMWQAAASAEDGLEAMSLLQKELFDLVITDIRMPGMDGLSLARYVSVNHTDTFMIILSGYDEFDYARAAVRLNVCDYLLKPLNDGELMQALEKVSQKLAENRRRRLTDASFPMLFRDTMSGMPQKALGENLRKMEEISKASGKVYWGLMVLAPSILDAARLTEAVDIDPLGQELFSLAFDSFSGFAAMDSHGNTVILVFVRDPLLNATECLLNCHRMNQTFQNSTGVSLLGGFSKVRSSLDQLKPAYEEANDALLLAQAGNGPYLSGDLLFAQRTRLGALKALADAGNAAVLESGLHGISSLCMQAVTCIDEPIRREAFLMMGAFLVSRCFGSGMQQLVGLRRLAEYVPDEAEAPDVFAKSYEACLISLLISDKQETEAAGLSKLTQKVQEYLHTHFKESVSLSIVADAFHVTPAYLSALFHKEVGESYSKYLMRLRMEYAAVKLQSDPYIKMYDVAKLAGFVSPKHFISAFRKFFGKTPKEYKEQYQK